MINPVCFAGVVFVLTSPLLLAQSNLTHLSWDGSGMPANGSSTYVGISGDGGVATYQSSASNLVAGDTNGVSDVFALTLGSNTIERVSVSSSGVQGNRLSFGAQASDAGHDVVFTSWADNFVPNDFNTTYDVFVRDRQARTTHLISKAFNGPSANARSTGGTISGDGRYVLFLSGATDIVRSYAPTNKAVYLHDRTRNVTTAPVRSMTGGLPDQSMARPMISGNGRYAIFLSQATNIVANMGGSTDNQVFRVELATGAIRLVSRSLSGVGGNGACYRAAISWDGRWVTFTSAATDLVGADTNNKPDVFLWENRAGGVVSRINHDREGQQSSVGVLNSTVVAIGGGGRFVAFLTADGLLAGQVSGMTHLYVYDLLLESSYRVLPSQFGRLGISPHALSASGRRVVFESDASILIPKPPSGVPQAWLHDQWGPYSFEYGSSFPQGALGPKLSEVSPPVIGRQLVVTVAWNHALYHANRFIILGARRTHDILPWGSTLYVFPDVLIGSTNSNWQVLAPGVIKLWFALPSNTSLLSGTVFLQFFKLSRDGASMEASNGLALRIGR